MDQYNAAKGPEKLLLRNLHRLLELSMLACGLRSVPRRVHASDAATQAGLDRVFHFRGFAHAAILAIDFNDELRVHFLVNFFQLLIVKRDAPVVRNGISDDLLAEVLEDEASAAQFGNVLISVGPGLLERSLVVVKPVAGRIINSADVAYNIEAVKYIFLSSSDDQAVSVLTGLQKHSCGEDLVAMERIAMGANEFLVCLGLNFFKLLHVFCAHNYKFICHTAPISQVFCEGRSLIVCFYHC